LSKWWNWLSGGGDGEIAKLQKDGSIITYKIKKRTNSVQVASKSIKLVEEVKEPKASLPHTKSI